MQRLKKLKMHCYYLKVDDDVLFKYSSKRPDFVLSPLKSMLNCEVDRLYLQQLEYEMVCTDYPVDYNCFEIGYCGHPYPPYANVQFKKSTNSILSHFQEEDHSFIHDIQKKIHNLFPYILFTDPRKTHPERI